MNQYLAEVQKNYQHQLGQAALGYLKAGLELFHHYYRYPDDNTNPQVALGNLAISTELVLKTFIAGKHLTLLFKNLPLEVRVFLTSHENLPNDFSLQAFDVDLKSAKYNSVEFDECVAVFYLFFQDSKQSLQPHLRFLASARNASVHSVLPTFHRYELERAAYVSLRVYDTLESAGAIGGIHYAHSPEDNKFLATFKEERLERVRKQIEAAKEHSKKLNNRSKPLPNTLGHWENLVMTCPICGSDAIMYGDSEIGRGHNGAEVLEFRPYNYHCGGCKLTLTDLEELQLAGIPMRVERSEDKIEDFYWDRRDPYDDNLAASD